MCRHQPSAEAKWVCIGDTTTGALTYETVGGTMEDTTLTMDFTHHRYPKFDVASAITELVTN